jgi:signal transduction histidine kinase
MKILTFILLFSLTTSAIGESDTEINASNAKTSQPVQSLLNEYLKKVEHHLNSDSDSAKFYLEKCMQVMLDPEISISAETYFQTASLLHNLGSLEDAVSMFEKAGEVSKTNDNHGLYIRSNNWLAYVYSQMGETERAVEILFNIIRFSEEGHINSFLPETYMMLGFTYRNFKDNRKAMEYFKQALDFAEEYRDTINLPALLNEIGNLYSMQDSVEKGLEYQMQALQIRTAREDLNGMGFSYNDIAGSYYYLNDLDNALKYYKRSLEIQNSINNRIAAFYCHLNIAYLYGDLKRYSDQKIHLDSAKYLAEIVRLKPVSKEIFEAYVKYYSETGDYRNAFVNYQLATAYSDSLKANETERQIALISAMYNTEKAERELSEREAENQRLKFIIGMTSLGLISLLIVTLLIIRSFYLRRKINRMLQLKNEEISAMNLKLIKHTEEIEAQRDEIEHQRDEYQKLNATKDKFFSIIAHDLKNPLAGLIGLTDLLTMEKNPFSEEEQKEVHSSINETVKTTYSLLENLLLWSRAQTKSLVVEAKNFRLFDMCDEIVLLYRHTADTRKIRLVNKCDPDLIVIADSNMIQTVIRNLVNNAVKFTGEGGTISIITELEEKYARVTVSDSGEGMTVEDIAKLFRTDVNVLTIGKGENKGSGLGLILCKEFIELNGGRIWALSKPGEGSNFIFTVPLAAGPEKKQPG